MIFPVAVFAPVDFSHGRLARQRAAAAVFCSADQPLPMIIFSGFDSVFVSVCGYPFLFFG